MDVADKLLIGSMAFGAMLIVVSGLKTRRAARRRRDEMADPASVNPNGVGALLTGAVLLFLLLICGGPPVLIHRNKVDFIKNNRPVASIAPAMADQKIMLEGYLSGSQDERYGLVAYRKYRLGRKTKTFDHERIPPLTVRVAGQSIHIEDHTDPESADYELAAPPWPRGIRGSISTYGITVDDPVLVVGVVRQDGGSTYVDADLVFGGNRVGYLNSEHARLPIWLLIIVSAFAIATGWLLLYGFASGAVGDYLRIRRSR